MDAAKFPLMEISSIWTTSHPPSQPTKRKLYERVEASRQRGWWFEFTCHFFSVLIFLGIIAVLYHSIHGKSAEGPILSKFSWYGAVTFLATMMKIAMLFGIASTLGQLKWSWYKEHRYLADLEIIGGVNGSVLGALKSLSTFNQKFVPLPASLCERMS